jgi:hypothetical protein
MLHYLRKLILNKIKKKEVVMTTCYKNALLFPLLLLTSIAIGQAERTFVKSFNLQGRQTVILNLGDNIQVNQWDGELMRVQMTVSTPSINNAMLKSVAESGRYMLKNDMTAPSTIVVTAPAAEKGFKINGNEVKEIITYTVFVPKNVTILKNTDPNSKIVAKMNP